MGVCISPSSRQPVNSQPPAHLARSLTRRRVPPQPFFAGVLARAGRRGEGGLTPKKKTQFKTKKTAEARREEREDASC